MILCSPNFRLTNTFVNVKTLKNVEKSQTIIMCGTLIHMLTEQRNSASMSLRNPFYIFTGLNQK